MASLGLKELTRWNMQTAVEMLQTKFWHAYIKDYIFSKVCLCLSVISNSIFFSQNGSLNTSNSPGTSRDKWKMKKSFFISRGSHFNIKMPSDLYVKSHCGDKTILFLSHILKKDSLLLYDKTENFTVNIRKSHDHLIYTVGLSSLVRQHISIETYPWPPHIVLFLLVFLRPVQFWALVRHS